MICQARFTGVPDLVVLLLPACGTSDAHLIHCRHHPA